ncbi:RagB/SusD family nutrient uptake outer membrane protein [Antarcticibacterium flavum]|uniref:RagB/SusD family nutrient uptake outer membrane protein n=1 Tax=Antarcticibacterium flavum TaxID=2058175 RepID=A0A5B7X1E2_9FLAO|nr:MULTISPECIES: RagB/SusD family nutrient uptake outer membrane protein [Antarcticibacterium]MCM4160453.1 RagB/SusD family nutrient uptake outer membrane protein [Antarcticibacterium sp. W02-3]QCY69197.1 RagB/SusD family nutrient uptake outer membrane protein [Antarcticibacterium flavum]
MKNYKLTLSILSAAFLMVSCEDELNLEPEQSISTEVAISTGENIENILIGTYAEAGDNVSYGGDIQILSDLYGFTDEASWVGTFAQPREVFNKRIFTDNVFVRDIWLNGYQIINQANLVVDYVDLVDEDRQATVEGEAKFLRALTYFDLVRLFGQQYEAGEQNTQLGVPLTLTGITDYSGDLEIPRNTVEEVYTQVVADLTDAYDLLPPSNGIFADKYAAQALLARVYLQMGNYEGARDAAHDVIENSGHSLTSTYAAAFNNDVDSSEDVFAFQVTSQDGENDLIIHYADQAAGGRGGDITINPAFIDRFDANDDRGDYFYASAQSGATLTGKYTNQFGNIPVIRLAEMYLIRAEANERLGTEIGNTPLEDINLIRSRANATTLSSVDLEDILEERELELAFEGFLIHDLKRTQRNVGDLEYNANALVFPVPQREIDANSLLVQNPGYGA